MNLDNLNDELDARREAQLRELGTRKPRCTAEGCEESDPFALTGAVPDILCYEHRADRDGRAWTEEHHVPGRSNSPAERVRLPGNDHRPLSEYQALWPRDTLRNPDGSPLLRAAAALRGWLDVLLLVIARTVGWIPPFLEQLDQHLQAALGSRWWDEMDGGRDA